MVNQSKPLAIFFAGMVACVTPVFGNDSDNAKAKELLKGEAMVDSISATFGRIGDTSIFFGRDCGSTSAGKAVLVKAEEGSWPVVWATEEGCISAVSWRDIDGDGTPEIKLNSREGGSGVLQSMAIFYAWDDGADAPREIVRFIENSYSTWDGMFGSYGFDTEKYYWLQTFRDNFLPVGTTCVSETDCGLVERKTFCVDECERALPEALTSRADWPALLAALAADGFESGNYTPAGEPPKVTQEVQSAFDAWLTE